MPYPRQQGLSLLELLVALSIFAIGILAIVRLQFLSFRNMSQGLLRTVAVLEVSNLLVQYRVWHQGNRFDSALEQWQQQLPQLLPVAKVRFAAQGPFCTVSLSWQPLAVLFDPEGMPLTLVDTLDYSG
ncbi:MAG: prepilin-type N-terminal cleavage/methylation domain-containing protein [Gammaproteobacteria bacterium]|nr:prepilin-type N-terminal cleavage/methylation domain-containing protein [Gammaproteobacteria bacterium]